MPLLLRTRMCQSSRHYMLRASNHPPLLRIARVSKAAATTDTLCQKAGAATTYMLSKTSRHFLLYVCLKQRPTSANYYVLHVSKRAPLLHVSSQPSLLHACVKFSRHYSCYSYVCQSSPREGTNCFFFASFLQRASPDFRLNYF